MMDIAAVGGRIGLFRYFMYLDFLPRLVYATSICTLWRPKMNVLVKVFSFTWRKFIYCLYRLDFFGYFIYRYGRGQKNFCAIGRTSFVLTAAVYFRMLQVISWWCLAYGIEAYVFVLRFVLDCFGYFNLWPMLHGRLWLVDEQILPRFIFQVCGGFLTVRVAVVFCAAISYVTRPYCTFRFKFGTQRWQNWFILVL